MKFNIIINNWNWLNTNNKLELGIDLNLNGYFKNVKNNTNLNNIVDLDFETFNYKTPTKNGAYCGLNQQLCDVLFEIERVELKSNNSLLLSSPSGPSPSGPSPSGPSPSGPSPTPSQTDYNFNVLYKFKYTFEYFGKKLVYDPIISTNTHKFLIYTFTNNTFTNNSITNNSITNNSITNNSITNNSITNNSITNNSITNNTINYNAILVLVLIFMFVISTSVYIIKRNNKHDANENNINNC